ncbi:hypothetical protein RHGRI_013162 [Rhododendron griersonianum]|uniref:Uncharacterized protein n=1 Tax=Rhododendron griersonianum TaxID=479676 RepID=A0AAV6K4Y0_9ERIC|nr:hypothetical protein RHGRI_013162 [Rhododendron griersonianum]
MLTESEDMDNVHMLFNVDETILNFEKPELFSKMKNINLLCLGRVREFLNFEKPELFSKMKNTAILYSRG